MQWRRGLLLCVLRRHVGGGPRPDAARRGAPRVPKRRRRRGGAARRAHRAVPVRPVPAQGPRGVGGAHAGRRRGLRVLLCVPPRREPHGGRALPDAHRGLRAREPHRPGAVPAHRGQPRALGRAPERRDDGGHPQPVDAARRVRDDAARPLAQRRHVDRRGPLDGHRRGRRRRAAQHLPVRRRLPRRAPRGARARALADVPHARAGLRLGVSLGRRHPLLVVWGSRRSSSEQQLRARRAHARGAHPVAADERDRGRGARGLHARRRRDGVRRLHRARHPAHALPRGVHRRVPRPAPPRRVPPRAPRAAVQLPVVRPLRVGGVLSAALDVDRPAQRVQSLRPRRLCPRLRRAARYRKQREQYYY